MSTPEERFLELWNEKYNRLQGSQREDARDAFRDFAAEYAFVPRADFPELDENGNASREWHKNTNVMEAPQKCRRYAALDLALAEWHEAKDQRDADTKAERALSERRNAVLAKVRKRFNSEQTVPYEGLYQGHTFRILVDMVIEAEDKK